MSATSNAIQLPTTSTTTRGPQLFRKLTWCDIVFVHKIERQVQQALLSSTSQTLDRCLPEALGQTVFLPLAYHSYLEEMNKELCPATQPKFYAET